MARPLRVEFPGALYHLTARGNARQAIFEDDADRRRFLRLLGREVEQQGWRCYAYCLMDNHYHLLIETPEPNLVTGMRRLNGAYTQGFNRRHKRVGHLFQGRYKSIVVERDAYLKELCRYIVLNPVRAGLVEAAHQWRWSSYPETARAVARPAWLHVDEVWSLFGNEERQARAAYRRFVRQGIKRPSPWEELRGQMWLGGREFLARMERLAHRQAMDDVPHAQRQPTRPTPEEVLHMVGSVYNLPPSVVLDRSHQPSFRAAVYLLRRVCNLPLKEVASRAAISPSRVSKIQHHVEHQEGDRPLRRLLEKCKVKN